MISSWSEVHGDVIVVQNVETTCGYHVVDFQVASTSSLLQENFVMAEVVDVVDSIVLIEMETGLGAIQNDG